MSTETLPQITPKSSQALSSTASSTSSSSSSSQERRSLRAKAMSPSTVRKAISLEDRSSNDLFSPTSAAAIALSSLHQFGAQRDNRAAPDTELKGTRLFNNPAETAPRVISQEESTTTETTSNDTTTTVTPTVTASDNKENKENAQTNDVATTTTATTANNNNKETRVPPATFTPSYHHHHHHPPPPHHHQTPPYPAPPHHHHPHHHPAAGQPPQTQQPYQAPPPPPHSWRRAPLPMHHPANYVARYPYTHAQMDPSYTAGWEQQQAQQQQPQQQQQQQAPPHTYNRSSPVSSLGPYTTAPMPRPPAVLQHPPPPPIAPSTTTAAHTKFARLASCASTLVTPTPKKAKLSHSTSTASSTSSTATKPDTETAMNPNYSRKKKSLGILAENFLNTYKCLAKGSTIVVDEAAVKLGVERRRIYDVVNILESICLVCKKHKNTYTWMGMEHLNAVFGRLQAQAIQEYPQDAQKYLGTSEAVVNKPVPLKPARKQSKSRENKSLAKLSQEFLQVFLVGHKTLSLPEASDKIQGTTSMEELIAMGSSKNQASTEKELKAAAARGLKTKIRRLYDIANVFLSVGLLKKVDRGDASRRPNFSWAYVLSAQEVYQMHRPGAANDEAATSPPLAEQQPPHPPILVAQEQPPHPPMVPSA